MQRGGIKFALLTLGLKQCEAATIFDGIATF
jgi:hypothetical protein